MRLQKYLALCGVASRRHAEEMIAQGMVQVNGQTIREMGVQVEDGDIVCVHGERVQPETEKRYVLYHKGPRYCDGSFSRLSGAAVSHWPVGL